MAATKMFLGRVSRCHLKVIEQNFLYGIRETPFALVVNLHPDQHSRAKHYEKCPRRKQSAIVCLIETLCALPLRAVLKVREARMAESTANVPGLAVAFIFAGLPVAKICGAPLSTIGHGWISTVENVPLGKLWILHALTGGRVNATCKVAAGEVEGSVSTT